MKNMKKLTILLLIVSAIGFISCKDDVAPVIALEGDLVMDHVLNQAFDEPGYKAFDDEDGDITENVQVTALDVNTAGEQFITYSVSDVAGNTAEEVRLVNVYNEASNSGFTGEWNGEYVFPYPATDKQAYADSITPSTSTNMNIVIHNFGGNANANVEGKLVISDVAGKSYIKFTGQSVNGADLVVKRADISTTLDRITFEYSIGGVDGVLVLAKN